MMKRPSKLFLGMVVVPFALLVGYYATMAEPRYTTEARVALTSFNAPTVPDVISLLGNGSSTHQEELYLVDHVQSLDMAKKLDGELSLSKDWALSKGTDFLYRIWSLRTATPVAEDYLAVYRRNVKAYIDPVTFDVVLRVQGFSPKQTYDIATNLVSSMERFTNEANQQRAKSQLDFATSEVETLHTRLVEAKAEVLAFQQKHQLLDAETEGKQKLAMIAALEEELTKAEAEVNASSAYLTRDSFQLKGLQQRVAALRAQVARERTALTQGTNRYSAKMWDFQELRMRAEMAEQEYKTALSSMEQIRVESLRKARKLTLIASPHLAEKPTYPQHAYELLLCLLSLLGLYGIARLTRALLQEHRI